MQSRTRYTLLAGCIFTFVVIAPLIIIFVGGYRYNSATKTFSKTGAISAQTDPKGADVYINGKKVGTTPKITRFLNAGVYEVTLSKPGYFTWVKNLGVTAQYVTLAHLGYNAVTMFFSVPTVTNITVTDPVIGFATGSSKLVYATAKNVTETAINSPQDMNVQTALPNNFASASSITITAAPGEDYFLLDSGSAEAIFVPSEKKVYPLEINVTANTWQFGDHGDLFALQGQNLVAINWRTDSGVAVITSPVIGYSWHAGYLYVLARANNGSTLEQMNTNGSDVTSLSNGLPTWQRASLYLNQVNQIAIVADGSLYSFTPSLQQISQYVTGMSSVSGTNKFFYYTKNEIGSFDASTNSLAPITRTSQIIDSSGISFSTGWAFYISNGQLQIIEVDTRGNQNIYLLNRVPDDAQFTVDPDAHYIYLLQNGQLERLQIR